MDLIYQIKVASFTFYPTWLSDITAYGINPSEITLMMFPQGPSATTQSSAIQLSGCVFNARKSEEEIRAAITYIEFMTGEEAMKSKAAFMAENDVVSFNLGVYDGIDYYDGMVELGIPQGWIDATKMAIECGNVCAYPSTAFTSYLTTQIPALTTDASKNIKETLAAAQKVAENEWLIGYNESVFYD